MNFKKWKDRVCLLEMQVMELKGVMDKSRLTHRHTKAVFDTDNEYYGNPWNFVKRPNISGDRYWLDEDQLKYIEQLYENWSGETEVQPNKIWIEHALHSIKHRQKFVYVDETIEQEKQE